MITPTFAVATANPEPVPVVIGVVGSQCVLMSPNDMVNDVPDIIEGDDPVEDFLDENIVPAGCDLGVFILTFNFDTLNWDCEIPTPDPDNIKQTFIMCARVFVYLAMPPQPCVYLSNHQYRCTIWWNCEHRSEWWPGQVRTDGYCLGAHCAQTNILASGCSNTAVPMQVTVFRNSVACAGGSATTHAELLTPIDALTDVDVGFSQSAQVNPTACFDHQNQRVYIQDE